MGSETTRAASGATILDLHSIRAGLAGELAELDQAEALRRQAVELRRQAVEQLGVGDRLRERSSGKVGQVVRAAGDRLMVACDGVMIAARRGQILEGSSLVELPSDCEAAS
jgi:hypothetical protein